uniref:Eyes absent homolog n=1 Tax=Acrobeloides nanus TaxID=290746 RepID=A0A914C6F9_9BILA
MASSDLKMPLNTTPSSALAAMQDVAVAAAGYDARMLSTPPYYNTNYANSAYGMYNPQYYQMAAASSLRGSTPIANYFTNPSAYYGGYAATNFDYSQYTSSAMASMPSYYGAPNGYYGPSASSSKAINPYATTDLSLTAGPSGSGSNGGTGSSSNGSQISPYSTKSDIPKRRAKKRRANGGLVTPEPNYTRVFVWELEDICILADPFIRLSMDPTWQRIIEQILVAGFHIEHLDEFDQIKNIEEAQIDESLHEICYPPPPQSTNSLGTAINHVNSSSHDSSGSAASAASPTGRSSTGISATPGNHRLADNLRRVSSCYQHIKNIYNQCKENFTELLNISNLGERSPDIHERLSLLESMNGSPTINYRRCMKIVMDRCSNEQTFTNLVMTNESLPSTFAKLIATDLSNWVPAENVYSSAKSGRGATIEMLAQRYKKSLLIISRNPETQELAKRENIPCWPIRSMKDVELFYLALANILL